MAIPSAGEFLNLVVKDTLGHGNSYYVCSVSSQPDCAWGSGNLGFSLQIASKEKGPVNKMILGMKVRTWLLAVALVGVVGILTVGSIAKDPLNPKEPEAASAVTSSEAAQYAKGLSKAFREAAGRALPSVVRIEKRPLMVERSDSRAPPDEGDELDDTPFGDLFRRNPDLRRFFRDMPRGMPSVPRREVFGVGSGVIIDESGIVLTNNHVVDGDGKVIVRLMDGREFEPAEIKTDRKADLAIVRIKGAGKLKAAKVADSDKVAVGDWVLALGDPFGLEGTVTAGIISAKGRSINLPVRADFLQTDAAINPGNSGGPLVNLDGEVVGINTAINSLTGLNMGVGFAVPINQAKWVADQLVKSGKVQRAFLGIGIAVLTQELAEQFGLKAREGVLVNEVFPDNPGAKAGLKPGDVIVKFAGKRVSTPQELQSAVETTSVGRSEPMEIIRDAKPQTLEVTLLEQPEDYGLVAKGPARSLGRPKSLGSDRLGVEVEPLTKEVADQLGLTSTEGVVITQVRPGSLADLGGLATGMVILEANHRPVKSAEDFRKAVTGQPLEKGVLLRVRTAEGTRFHVLRADKR